MTTNEELDRKIKQQQIDELIAKRDSKRRLAGDEVREDGREQYVPNPCFADAKFDEAQYNRVIYFLEEELRMIGRKDLIPNKNPDAIKIGDVVATNCFYKNQTTAEYTIFRIMENPDHTSTSIIEEILPLSPIGSGLLGHTVNDKVKIIIPSSKIMLCIEILAINPELNIDEEKRLSR